MCDEQRISINMLEEKIGLGKNTLYSWGKKIPTGTNLEKVADYFDVSVDYLLGRTNKKRYHDLSEKDGLSIQRELKKAINGEDVDNAFAAFDGEILEELNEEDRELLIGSWENTIRLTKYIANKKRASKKFLTIMKT